MSKPRYTVYKTNKGKWAVGHNQRSLGGRFVKIKEFSTKPEAEEYAQSCVEDDHWNAANRD